MSTRPNYRWKILEYWARQAGIELDEEMTKEERFEYIAKIRRWKPQSKKWLACWKHAFGVDYPRSNSEIPTVDGLAAATKNLSLESNTDNPNISLESKAISPSISLESKASDSNIDDLTAAAKTLSLNSNAGEKKDSKSGGIKVHAVHEINSYFDKTYGTNVTKLEVWQQICIDVGLEPQGSIKKCKQALRRVYVNIHDFLEEPRPVRRFHSYNSFLKYTRAGRTFPLRETKKDGFIRIFLREVRW